MPITLDGTAGITFPDGITLSSGVSGGSQSTSTYPLKSGTSVVAGKVVGINLSGETGEVPVTNTYGTRVTAANVGQGTLSTDGSRMLQHTIAYSGAGPVTSTGTFRGSAVNQTTGAMTVGGTTVTATHSWGPASFSGTYANVWALSATTFLVHFHGQTQSNDCGNAQFFIRSKLFVVTVDASGNCTKGTEYAIYSNDPFGSEINAFMINTSAQVAPNIYVQQIVYSFNGSTTSAYYTITASGTVVTQTADAEAVNFFNSNRFNTCVTSSNVIVAGDGNVVRTAAYTSGNIGTITNTTVITDATSTPAWTVVGNTRLICFHYVTNASGATDSKVKSFTINQTTGAVTLVDTLTNPPFLVGGWTAWKDATSGVFSWGGSRANSISLQAGGTFSVPTFNTGGANTTQLGNGAYPTYITGDRFFFFEPGSSSVAPTITPYTVVSYATTIFNYLGICKTSTSTSPAIIVTDGIASGFTGLTTGLTYYSTSPFDGNVTTTNISGILIGKAVSTTQILLSR
jgi:hypothetical protein